MSYKTVKFIGKEYTIPTDLLKYIELLELTNEVRMAINKKFLNLLRYSEVGCIDTDELAPEIEYQVSRYIKKLLNSGIYDRTVNDYLRANKGYTLISEVNAAAFAKVKELLIQKLDDYAVGLDEALTKRDSSITGLGFSIWSSSFINHAIYAAMEASELHKQESAANAEYQRDINALSNNVSAKYDGEQKRYIENVYIPNMDKAIAIFAFELLDTFISDLIKNGKNNNEILSFINIDRSNDLLKNLVLSKNKVEVLQKAFEACPYNLEVFIRAYNIDLLDYDTFQTAKYFKHDYTILRKLEEGICNLKYPSTFIINYKKAEQYADFTDSDITSVLLERTEYFAYEVVEAYGKTFKLLNNKAKAEKMMREFPESAILTGDNVSKGKAQKCINEIVSENTWRELTGKCGHTNLLDRIKAQVPGSESASTKHDIDAFLKEQLYQLFEGIRQEIANSIKERMAQEQREKEEQEKLRIEHEKQKAEEERIRKEKRDALINKAKNFSKKFAIGISIIVSTVLLLTIAVTGYLFITDKPIATDFEERIEYDIHNLTYYIPANWEFASEDSNDSTMYHVRYNNFGKFICYIGIKYEGDSPETCVDNVANYYTSTYSNGETHTKNIGKQKFSVVTYPEVIDYTEYLCHVYITEIDSSIFQFFFKARETDSDTNLFDNIVRAAAFDKYINPKNDTYNYALELMREKQYEKAIEIFESLNGYKDCNDLISECLNIIDDNSFERAKTLIDEGNYEAAYNILITLNDYAESVELLKCFKLVWEEANSVDIYGGAGIKDDYFSHFFSYDDSGRLTNEMINFERGTTTVEYIYNSKGNLTKILYKYFDDDTATRIFTYDSNNRIIKDKYTNSDGDYEISTYEYDENGNLKSCIMTNDAGVKFFYEYDFEYDECGCLTQKTKHLFKKISVKTYEEDITWITEYSYKNHNLYEVSEYQYGDLKGNEYCTKTKVIYSENGFSHSPQQLIGRNFIYE